MRSALIWLTLLVTAVLAKHEEVILIHPDFIAECRELHDIDDDAIDYVQNLQFKDRAPEGFKCFIKCLFTKEQIIVDGQLQHTKFLRHFQYSRDIADKIFDACFAKMEKKFNWKGCGKEYATHRCILDNLELFQYQYKPKKV